MHVHIFSVEIRVAAYMANILMAAACLSISLAAEGGGSSRPSIVFIMTDDQAFDAVTGGERFPSFQMPNFDRLARDGVRFRNAFVTTSLCSPSRATCLTGLYSHKTGVPGNDPGMDPAESVPLISEMLQEAGYTTAFIGKWHMAPTDRPRRGFDYWLSFEGQGVYDDPVLNLNGERFQAKGYITDILTDYAVKWIETRPTDKPLAVFLWHKAPHEVVKAAERHRSLYRGFELTEPPNYRDSYFGKPEWFRRGLLFGLHAKDWSERPVPPEIGILTPFDRLKHSASEYLRALAAVDESTGRVLDVLDRTGRRDNSLVLYTSDNGMNFFAHQSQIDKRTMWEESIRIPLVIQFPNLLGAGTTVDAAVLNVDFAPTILKAAGISVPASMDGRPLQPLVSGSTPSDWRKSFLYIYRRESYAPGIATMVGVRTDRFKLVCYPEEKEGLGELFDLKADPQEMHNVINDLAYADVLAQMQQEMRRQAAAVDYKLPEDIFTKKLKVTNP